mmetsp:Transcript_19131/g.48603  ORF Transcript_19131/g.48603 Transcript_19131/m.48603 type:complete len:219 (+) Transcript_19131:2-658(+)
MLSRCSTGASVCTKAAVWPSVSSGRSSMSVQAAAPCSPNSPGTDVCTLLQACSLPTAAAATSGGHGHARDTISISIGPAATFTRSPMASTSEAMVTLLPAPMGRYAAADRCMLSTMASCLHNLPPDEPLLRLPPAQPFPPAPCAALLAGTRAAAASLLPGSGVATWPMLCSVTVVRCCRPSSASMPAASTAVWCRERVVRAGHSCGSCCNSTGLVLPC